MVDADLVPGAPDLIAGTGITGQTAGTRLGRNLVIPSTLYIILSNATSVTFPINVPAAPQQMQVVSSSALDTMGGIGIN